MYDVRIWKRMMRGWTAYLLRQSLINVGLDPIAVTVKVTSIPPVPLKRKICVGNENYECEIRGV